MLPLETGKRAIKVQGLGYKDGPYEIDIGNGAMDFLKVVTTKGFGGFTATLTLEPRERPKAVAELAGLKREPERYIDKDI